MMVSDITMWTGTLDSVIVYVALSYSGARVSRARILALVVDAGFVCWTVGVAATSQEHAADLRITTVS